MSEKTPGEVRPPSEMPKSCPHCGVELSGGKPINIAAKSASAARAGNNNLGTWILVVAIAAVIWWMIQPKPEEQRVESRMASAGGGGGGGATMQGSLPEGHPPIDGMGEGGAGAAGDPHSMMPDGIMERLADLKDRVEKDPNDTDALKELGHMYYDIQRADQAIDYYHRYLNIIPDDAEVHTDIGAMFFQKEDLDHAEEHFRTAIALNPALPEPVFNLSLVYLAREDFDGAISNLQKAKSIATDGMMRESIDRLIIQAEEAKAG